MFGPPGMAYVYLVYGMYDCLNVVSGRDGAASAVLVRAVEPLAGIEAMVEARRAFAARRARPAASPRGQHDLASGPGRLCAAFSIDRSFSGADLCDPDGVLHLEVPAPGDRPAVPAWSPRIGVAYAGEPWTSIAWRLADLTSPALSAPIPAGARDESDPEPGLPDPRSGSQA